MIINYKDLVTIKNENKDKKIVLCAGCYDLFHIGHLHFINKAKMCGDILVVSVLSDEFTRKSKNNNRPIIKERDRSIIIDNLKSVDYTIILNKSKKEHNLSEYNLFPKEQQLIEKYIPIIEELHPDIFFLSQETRISASIKRILNDMNVEIVMADYDSKISTTSIIEYIQNIKNE